MIATPSPVAREVPGLGSQLRMLVAMKECKPEALYAGEWYCSYRAVLSYHF